MPHLTLTEPYVVSSGTLRSEDLIPTFLEELRRHRATRTELMYEAECWIEGIHVYNLYRQPETPLSRDEYQACGAHIVSDLADDLDGLAPEHLYFGACEGDGACFGFFPNHPDD